MVQNSIKLLIQVAFGGKIAVQIKRCIYFNYNKMHLEVKPI